MKLDVNLQLLREFLKYAPAFLQIFPKVFFFQLWKKYFERFIGVSHKSDPPFDRTGLGIFSKVGKVTTFGIRRAQ